MFLISLFLVVGLDKKANGVVVVVIVIVLIIIAFLVWFAGYKNRECNSNRDCNEDYYCGSDFSCHEYPTIERTITNVDYTRPALIIGIAILLVFLVPKFLDFIRESRAEKNKIKEETAGDKKEEREITEEKVEDKKEEKSKKPDYDYTYYNYPVSHKYSVKTAGKKEKTEKKEIIGDKRFFFNNYIGMILGGLIAIGIVLATNIDYILASLLGGVLLFILVYKLWSYSIEYDAEFHLAAILCLIYIILSLIYFLKGGLLMIVGIGFLAVTIFVFKETMAWMDYKRSQ